MPDAKECRTTKYKSGGINMALSNLYGWNTESEQKTAAACGTGCGAGDAPKEVSTACGSACGAGDAPKEETPAACGTSCGAGDVQ